MNDSMARLNFYFMRDLRTPLILRVLIKSSVWNLGSNGTDIDREYKADLTTAGYDLPLSCPLKEILLIDRRCHQIGKLIWGAGEGWDPHTG